MNSSIGLCGAYEQACTQPSYTCGEITQAPATELLLKLGRVHITHRRLSESII